MSILRHRAITALSLSFLVCLSGCATGVVDLDGQDRKAFLPALRATVPVSGGSGEWEFGVSQGSGSYSNAVPPGSVVDFGGTAIPGADRVTTDIDLRVWQMLYATATSNRDRPSYMGGRFLVGFNWIEMDTTLRTTAAGGPYRWDDGAGSLVLGFEADVIAPPGPFAGAVRMLGAMGGHSNMVTFFGDAEIRGTYRFTPYTELFAGWRWWSYTYFHSDFASDLDTQLSGPTLGLHVRY